MAVRFLDVNGIFEKRIIRTFGKCTRLINQYSDERHTRDGSTEPGDSAAGEAEISLIYEAVTAVWTDFGIEADEKGKPRSPEMPRAYASHQVSAKDSNLYMYGQIVLLLVRPCLTSALAKLYGYFRTIHMYLVISWHHV